MTLPSGSLFIVNHFVSENTSPLLSGVLSRLTGAEIEVSTPGKFGTSAFTSSLFSSDKTIVILLYSAHKIDLSLLVIFTGRTISLIFIVFVVVTMVFG